MNDTRRRRRRLTRLRRKNARLVNRLTRRDEAFIYMHGHEAELPERTILRARIFAVQAKLEAEGALPSGAHGG